MRALYNAIEERDVNSNWTILNIIDFINIYDKYKLTLNINSINNKALVTLQTAHKSKGLEYDYVYIIDAEDKIWNGNKKKNITSIPKFLYQILTGPSEDEDDSVRLLYVSMTRAKHHLYISHVNTINRHIPQINSEQSNETVSTEENILNKNILALENSLSPAIYNIAEENILRSLLENYQMSITHLNNYLKIEEGGPVHFFKENLLRFPQPMNSSGAYGSAIHDAIESIFTTQITNNISNKENIKHEANVMALEGVINKFRISLSKKRLDKIEENKLYNRGVEVLTNFYEKKYPIPHTLPEGKGMGDGMIEYNLAHENIQIGEAHITGKLDYVYIVDNKVNVLDWKTGKTLHSWDKGLSAVEKVKAHRYKYQLMMYRLLIESSNKFKSYSMGEFGLQFVEDENIFTLYYEHDTVGYERFKKLLIAVWQAINNLEFSESIDYIPTSDYETLKLEDLIKWEDEMISNHKI